MSSDHALKPASGALAAPFADAALARPDRFEDVRAAAARAPLTEIVPAAPGQEWAALGFALAWLSHAGSGEVGTGSPPGPRAARKPGSGQTPDLIVWIAPERLASEYGIPCAEGLAQFGLAPDRLLLVATRSLEETLWATEEVLSTPGVSAFAILPPATKPASLPVTRRLLLRAERRGTRGVLLRLDPPAPTAAWTRWRIAAAPSCGEARELGPPAVCARLDRNRAGPAGAEWTLVWNASAHAFLPASRALFHTVAGALVPTAVDRPAAARRPHAA